MIKVAIMTPNLSMGGAERWVVTLLKYADPQRIQFTGVAISGWGGLDPRMCEEIIDTGVSIHAQKHMPFTAKGNPTPQAKSPDCERYLIRHNNLNRTVSEASLDADILLAWGSPTYRRHLEQQEVPKHFVYCSHSSHHAPAHVPPVAYCTTHLTAVSERAMRPITHEGNPPITIMYNGVPEDRLVPVRSREAIRGEWGAGDRKVIGYIGRQSTEKNPVAAIQAINHLDGDWMAVYYGSTMNLSARPQPAFDKARENPAKNVMFFDSVQDVGSVYSGIDVLMLASHHEAFSLTMIEAWLAGVPVVSTSAGAVPELQTRYGKLVIEVPLKPTGAQLAAACKLALSPEGTEIAARAKQLAQNEFTVAHMMQRWDTYLHNAIK